MLHVCCGDLISQRCGASLVSPVETEYCCPVLSGLLISSAFYSVPVLSLLNAGSWMKSTGYC